MIAGGAATVAGHIHRLVEGDGIDNILLMFPDYRAGIETFAGRVAPLLRQRGIAVLAEAKCVSSVDPVAALNLAWSSRSFPCSAPTRSP